MHSVLGSTAARAINRPAANIPASSNPFFKSTPAPPQHHRSNNNNTTNTTALRSSSSSSSNSSSIASTPSTIHASFRAALGKKATPTKVQVSIKNTNDDVQFVGENTRSDSTKNTKKRPADRMLGRSSLAAAQKKKSKSGLFRFFKPKE